jgi:hypothetical protein
MILISHRGNINGSREDLENKPEYVDYAISIGYDVEVDVWYIDGVLWLGHDKPEYNVDFTWFIDRVTKLWIHCKNIDSLLFFKTNQHEFNYFWHETDTITLTSYNHIWAYPGKQPIKNSIAVMPEINNDILTICIGICSDKISDYNDKNNNF